MKNLWKLICLAGMLLMFTQCGKDSEPEPETVQETWQLTYDDYHVVKLEGIGAEIPREYQNITRNVTVLRNGNDLSIKGIFKEYPDAWTNFTIKGDKLYAEQAQVLEDGVSDPMLFYWGKCEEILYAGTSLRIDGIKFDSYIPIYDIHPGFKISVDDNTISYTEVNGIYGAFWYEKKDVWNVEFSSSWRWDEMENERTDESSTGYPDVGYMVNMVFRKVRNNKE